MATKTNIKAHFENVFEAELLNAIIEVGFSQEYAAGTNLINHGDTVKFIPLILKGLIKISRIDDQGRELLLYYVNPTESCAMTFTCCMQQKQSKIQATAEENVEIWKIPISYMDGWMNQYSSWKNFVMNTIQSRFDELLTTIDQITFQKLDERLIHYLKEKSKVTSSALINLSHEQIAQELATSRVVVSRLLKKLENDEKLLLYRHQIKLLKSL